MISNLFVKIEPVLESGLLSNVTPMLLGSDNILGNIQSISYTFPSNVDANPYCVLELVGTGIDAYCFDKNYKVWRITYDGKFWEKPKIYDTNGLRYEYDGDIKVNVSVDTNPMIEFENEPVPIGEETFSE